MPRPKNEEMRMRMLYAAGNLFARKGFNKTSYGDVAAACGTTRGLVQHYFPKKDQMALGFMTEVIDAAQAAIAAQDEGLEQTGTGGQMLRIGQVFFEYFLQSPGLRRFLYDIIVDRERTENVLAFNIAWAAAFEHTPERTQDKDFESRIALAMGGFYQLLYRSLRGEWEGFDVTRHLSTPVKEWMAACGADAGQAQSQLQTAALSATRLERAIAAMNGNLGIAQARQVLAKNQHAQQGKDASWATSS